MNPPVHPPLRPPTPLVLALALLAAFGAARAEITTDHSVSVGAGFVSGDRAERALFGQYNGLRTHRTVGLLGAEYLRHDDESGRTVRFTAVNLLGDTRELDVRWKHQGDWKFGASYDEQVRHDPLTPSGGAELSLKRTRLGMSFSKVLGPLWQFDVSLSSEDKEGARLFGIGMNCPTLVAPGCRGTTGIETGWALLMLPEPVKANHSQVEARFSYGGERLNLSAGYHGSFYRNRYGSLSPAVPDRLNNPLGEPLPPSAGLFALLSLPVALAPDNQAHQLDFSGNFAFTPTTRLNFKLAYARALQDQDFAAAGFGGAPAGVQNLGGRVDTTLAQLGLTARPLPKLALLAKLRWEDRDDRTPIAAYNLEGTSVYTNRRLPATKVRGQLQASYQFSSDYRGTLGAEHETIDRGVFTPSSAVAGLSALRQKTDETTVRAELRRRMNEDISGAISVARSRRGGSNWLRDNSGLGVTEVTDPADPAVGFANAIFMPTLADRERDTLKLQADWQPTEALVLQFSAQGGRDRFDTPSALGLRRTGSDQASVDASYAISDAWQLNGYLGHATETLRQARPAATILAYDNTSRSVGLGVTGRISAQLDISANLSHLDDRSVYAQTLAAEADGASVALLAATGGLPDIVFRQTQLKLSGRYQVSKQSEILLDLVHQRSSWSDWAWTYNGVDFRYADGSTLLRQPRQEVSFIGLRYVWRWK